jgi:hypothetical protein
MYSSSFLSGWSMHVKKAWGFESEVCVCVG